MFRKIFFNILLSVEFMLYEKLTITFPFMDFFFIVFKLLKLFNIFPTFLSVYRQKDEYKPKKGALLHKKLLRNYVGTCEWKKNVYIYFPEVCNMALRRERSCVYPPPKKML